MRARCARTVDERDRSTGARGHLPGATACSASYRQAPEHDATAVSTLGVGASEWSRAIPLRASQPTIAGARAWSDTSPNRHEGPCERACESRHHGCGSYQDTLRGAKARGSALRAVGEHQRRRYREARAEPSRVVLLAPPSCLCRTAASNRQLDCRQSGPDRHSALSRGWTWQRRVGVDKRGSVWHTSAGQDGRTRIGEGRDDERLRSCRPISASLPSSRGRSPTMPPSLKRACRCGRWCCSAKIHVRCVSPRVSDSAAEGTLLRASQFLRGASRCHWPSDRSQRSCRSAWHIACAS